MANCGFQALDLSFKTLLNDTAGQLTFCSLPGKGAPSAAGSQTLFPAALSETGTLCLGWPPAEPQDSAWRSSHLSSDS